MPKVFTRACKFSKPWRGQSTWLNLQTNIHSYVWAAIAWNVCDHNDDVLRTDRGASILYNVTLQVPYIIIRLREENHKECTCTVTSFIVATKMHGNNDVCQKTWYIETAQQTLSLYSVVGQKKMRSWNGLESNSLSLSFLCQLLLLVVIG